MMTRINMFPLASGLSGPYVIEMQDLEGIVGRTREWVCLDLGVNTTHNLATWALSNELSNHSVSYGGVIDSFPSQTLPPMAHA